MAGQGQFSYAVTVRIPFPTHRLAEIALRSLSVDKELSPLVTRQFSLASPGLDSQSTNGGSSHAEIKPSPRTGGALTLGTGDYATGSTPKEELTVLVTEYKATTNRMLRVAVNGFFESVGVVIACMKELDEDMAETEWKGDGLEEVDTLARVQGLQEADTIG